MRRFAALFVLVVLAAPAVAAPVRIFAVGHKVRLDDALTYQTFHDKMAALMDARFRAPGLVQDGVDDVASHIRPADPGTPANALVVFPEDTGLVAALIGSRGAISRSDPTAVDAIADLLAPYQPQRSYYGGKYPGQPFVRTLVLALTDTFYRSFYETFRELAMSHGVYLATAANVAAAWRVEESED